MYFLSFETSTKIFSLALSKDDKVMRYRNLKTSHALEDCILPAMDKILDAAGIGFSQIDAFAVATGPGSFTSLRVGLSTIKAFAMAGGKPVVGIPTLDIVAHGIGWKDQWPEECDEICVVSDARRGKVYACLYGPKGKSEYLLSGLDQVLEKVHGRTLFAGDALAVYRKDIEKAYRTYAAGKKTDCKCLFAPEKWWYPQARIMAQLAYERLRNKQYDGPAGLLPLYLYPQDCQVSKA